MDFWFTGAELVVLLWFTGAELVVLFWCVWWGVWSRFGVSQVHVLPNVQTLCATDSGSTGYLNPYLENRYVRRHCRLVR